ncbi:MAG: 16S rRNA processing protein RimM [Candidatus Angelobacter sp. Gp1-AA117]|nr:MAG: 16S rRNA processing protein RimM [Candidatus Angelobacter sp. Gp1-AA117]
MVEKEHQTGHGKSPSGAGAAAEFITIAKVIKTQGRLGEVAATLFTDFPERFAGRKRLLLLDQKDQRRELELEDYWFHKGHVVLKFQGVDSISDAETLVGCEVQIPRVERTELEAGEIYVSDLIGCAVYDAGREIGKIQNVQFGAGEAPLLVIRGEKEHLVPFVTEYIENIVFQQQRVEMKLPQGMLELDAPLTAEEKQRQKKPD